MKRIAFYLWLISSGAFLGVMGWVFRPHGIAWMLALALWALLVVPLSFMWLFKREHQKEIADVETALSAWKARAPGAGKLMATALQESLDDEDEVSLERLLRVMEGDADAAPFIEAARGWIKHKGGRSAREEKLETVRAAMQPLLPRLTAEM